jgi:hypothetical protein
MYAEAGEVVPARERIGLVDADTDLRYEVGDVALLGETLPDRDGTVDGVSLAVRTMWPWLRTSVRASITIVRSRDGRRQLG